MCEFKTGDKVLVLFRGDWYEKIYLYTSKNGDFVCQENEVWENNELKTNSWRTIRPIPRYEERILDPVRMMQWLIEHEYEPTACGDWVKHNRTSFGSYMWQYCGGTNKGDWVWLPEWIEKVEVK